MSAKFHFNNKAFGFDSENALSLARSAKLVYEDFSSSASNIEHMLSQRCVTNEVLDVCGMPYLLED